MNIMRTVSRRVGSPACEGGFSLVEALIAMVLFVSVMSVMATPTMTNNMRQAEGVSLATDQVRLGFQRLDKQVRYADAISPPGPGADGSGRYVEIRLEDSQRENRADSASVLRR